MCAECIYFDLETEYDVSTETYFKFLCSVFETQAHDDPRFGWKKFSIKFASGASAQLCYDETEKRIYAGVDLACPDLRQLIEAHLERFPAVAVEPHINRSNRRREDLLALLGEYACVFM